MVETDNEKMFLNIQRIINKWDEKAYKSNQLTEQYTRCANIYKNTDKGFRGAISICSLIAAYMISFQSSGDTALTGNTGNMTTVFYLEIFFSFSAAAISIISQIINFPGLIEDNSRKALEFKDAKKYCYNQAKHCKWVKENIIDECPKIANLTVIRLIDTKRDYNDHWQSLSHTSKCCSNCCNVGIDNNSTEQSERPPPLFEGGDVGDIQLSPTLKWIQAKWGSPKNKNVEIENCICQDGIEETKHNVELTDISTIDSEKSTADNEPVIIEVIAVKN